MNNEDTILPFDHEIVFTPLSSVIAARGVTHILGLVSEAGSEVDRY